MGFLGGLISAISSPIDAFTGGLISDYFDRKQEKRQYKRQTDFWKMQSEYDSPKNQMARFKEAGLNPNLIYGQTNTSSSLPSVSTSRHNITADGPLSSYLNKKQQSANIEAVRTASLNSTKNTNADIELKKAQIRELNARTSQIRQSTDIEKSNSSYHVDGDGDLVPYKSGDNLLYRTGARIVNGISRFFSGLNANISAGMKYNRKHSGYGAKQRRYSRASSNDFENYLRSINRY